MIWIARFFGGLIVLDQGSYLPLEDERRFIHRLIERLAKRGAGVSFHARRW